MILNNPELFVQVSHMDGTDEDDIRQSLVNAGIRMEAANRLVGTPTSSVQQAHENRHERLMNQFRDKFREIKNLNPKLRPAEITALVNQELPGIEQQLQKAGALVR